ncbi:MAG: alanine racemase [Oscillospiraceae bacterium]
MGNVIERCWAEIDLDALRSNFDAIKSRLKPETKVLAVIKADAYGHGAVPVAKVLEKKGADWFAVATFEEALELRDAGISRPILLLGYAFPDKVSEAVMRNVTLTVSSLDHAKAISEEAERFGLSPKVHIKIDTGMSRLGIRAADEASAIEDIVSICGMKNLTVTGIFTHFSSADGTSESDDAETNKQYIMFSSLIDKLAGMGITFDTVHCANSAAIFKYPQYQCGMVRAGIALYGIDPAGIGDPSYGLKPVMSLKATVTDIRTIEEGDTVGYSRTFTAQRRSRIATIAIGYADGISRRLSNNFYVYSEAGLLPIVGNVCMDQMMVDATDASGSLKPGDTVTIFGGGSPIDIYNIAGTIGTIPYEVLCGISKRVKRVYIG